MPNFIRWRFLNCLSGVSVKSTSRIGLSLICVDELVLGDNASIGSFCVVRNTPKVILGDNAVIGAFNWITTIPTSSGAFKSAQIRSPSLTMGSHAAITSRHYIDIQDKVEICEFATLAGVRSTIFTHGIDINSNCQVVGTVKIGAYSYVGSNVIILAGAIIPPKSVVAAGAVFLQKANISGLYAGVPAIFKRHIQEGAKHFKREIGEVN